MHSCILAKKRLTSAATVLLITAVHAVRVRVTSPADRDTVTALTLELVVVTLQITAMLKKKTHMTHGEVVNNETLEKTWPEDLERCCCRTHRAI